MERSQTFWQFKDTVLTLADVDRFIGATANRVSDGSELRLVCRRATRDAKRRAFVENEGGRVTIVIEEEEG